MVATPLNIKDNIMSKELITQEEQEFNFIQRKAQAFISGSILPVQYRNIGDVIILEEMSKNLKIPMVMLAQGLYIVKNKPSMSGQLVIALLNGSGRFDAPIQWEERAEPWGVRAFASIDGNVLYGDWVDDKLITANNWGSNSHWKNNKILMSKYRSASWFGRLYAPDLLMGFRTEGEVEDTQPTPEETAVEAEIVEEAKTQKDHTANKRELSKQLTALSFTKADVTAFAKMFDLGENVELVEELITSKESLLAKIKIFEDK